MSEPLDILRKLGLNLPDPAQSAPLAPGEDMPGSGPKWLDPIVEGGLGLVGLGPNTKANRFGQMVSAGIPVFGAVSRGMGAAREAPGASSAILKGLQRATPTIEDAAKAAALQGGEYGAVNEAQQLVGAGSKSALSPNLGSYVDPHERLLAGLGGRAKMPPPAPQYRGSNLHGGSTVTILD